MPFGKVYLVWFALVINAILNGAIREKVFSKFMSERVSLPVSGILLSGLIFLVTYLSIELFDGLLSIQYLYVGLVWIVSTLAFEYGFGHYVQGKSWQKLNQIFNVKTGNLFILVMLVTVASPYLAAMAKGQL